MSRTDWHKIMMRELTSIRAELKETEGIAGELTAIERVVDLLGSLIAFVEPEKT